MRLLAYECSCHINPPCYNCEQSCEDCEGTGKINVRRNSAGKIDYVDGTRTSETVECDRCHGAGMLV